MMIMMMMNNMKIVLLIILTLAISGCSEPREKIYPKNGLFPKTKTRYELYCQLNLGRSQSLYKFDLTLDKKKAFFKIHESKKTFLVKNLRVHEDGWYFNADGDENYFYSDKLAGLEKKDRMYMLKRETGLFMAGLGEKGVCIERGFEWKLNKTKTHYEYVRY